MYQSVIPSTIALLAAGDAPVVDVDGTLFVQLTIFLVLMAILNPLLFKPWIEVRERRAKAIDGAMAGADDLRAKSDALSEELASKLATIEEEALEFRARSRREVDGVKARELADARVDATKSLTEARSRMDTQAAEATEQLERRVDELAQQVANKILRRAS